MNHFPQELRARTDKTEMLIEFDWLFTQGKLEIHCTRASQRSLTRSLLRFLLSSVAQDNKYKYSTEEFVCLHRRIEGEFT